ncbi:hypothetical protein ACFVIM_01420 [Streptomyces sp. NPDC057638]|uniref:hypothetical protein n=1 Tax=Streptomyces sp. NPDC057638 TaxID=3346190 RepID=UPI0036D1F886
MLKKITTLGATLALAVAGAVAVTAAPATAASSTVQTAPATVGGGTSDTAMGEWIYVRSFSTKAACERFGSSAADPYDCAKNYDNGKWELWIWVPSSV